MARHLRQINTNSSSRHSLIEDYSGWTAYDTKFIEMTNVLSLLRVQSDEKKNW